MSGVASGKRGESRRGALDRIGDELSTTVVEKRYIEKYIGGEICGPHTCEDG